jgi:hypothetical protein
LDVDSRWYKHNPPPVIENDQGKVLWDFPIQPGRSIPENRPDIVIRNKMNRSVFLKVDVSVPNDSNVSRKHQENIEKYEDLKAKISHLWECMVQIVPLMVGATRVVQRDIVNLLAKASPTASLSIFQKSALFGSARLIHQTLGLDIDRV